MKKNMDLSLLIIRLSTGILMLLHGIAKIIHGISYIKTLMTDHGLPAAFAYGVYIGEVAAPVLIILGFRTRLAALALAVNCLVIIFIAHPAEIFKLNEFGGWSLELPGLFLSGALVLLFTGAGKYALGSKSRWD